MIFRFFIGAFLGLTLITFMFGFGSILHYISYNYGLNAMLLSIGTFFVVCTGLIATWIGDE